MITLFVLFTLTGYLGSEAILISDNIKKLISEKTCNPFANFKGNLSDLYTYCNVENVEDPEKFVSTDEHPLVCKALYESVDLVCSNPQNQYGVTFDSFCAYQWSYQLDVLNSRKSLKNIKSFLSLFPQHCQKICEDLYGKDRPSCTAIGFLLLKYQNMTQPSNQLENNAVGKKLLNNNAKSASFSHNLDKQLRPEARSNSTKLAKNGVSNNGSGSELKKALNSIGRLDTGKPVNGVNGLEPDKQLGSELEQDKSALSYIDKANDNSVSRPLVKSDNYGLEPGKPLGNGVSGLKQDNLSVNGVGGKSFPESEKPARNIAGSNIPLPDGNEQEMPEKDFPNVGNDDLQGNELSNRKGEKSVISPLGPADNQNPPVDDYHDQAFEDDEERGEFESKNFAANHPPENSIPKKEVEEPKDSAFVIPPDEKKNEDKLDGINEVAKDEETNAKVGDSEKLKPDGYTVVVQQDTFVEAEDSNFLKYFVIFSIVSFICYISLHNKRKIMALLIEGRQGRSKRRPSSSAYSKLDTNLEEAMMSDAPKYNKSIVY